MLTSLAMLGTACSSDDNKEGGSKEMVLMFDAYNQEIVQGSKVGFLVLVGDGEDFIEMEDGVKFYADGKEISNPHVFEEVGEYNVVAKKRGYKDSNVLVVKVGEIEEPGVRKSLTVSLSDGRTEVWTGEGLRFVVKDDEGIMVTNAIITLSDGTDIGYDWYTWNAGTYKIFASLYGYESSPGFILTVKER
ncbi:hypothetical protein [Myroides fluvii]|uniref:hypothetical protein n=1 Tax=Myroides fluvii TaxID=2572594 RepID=UPI00131E5E93|nr:hypothetical protein [Myroides fluvii]